MTGKKRQEKSQEDLADYVRRIRKEKGLSLKDVEEQSGRRISKGYISYYINPTRDKLIALALGLGVTEDEIFDIARGKPAAEESGSEEKDPTRKTLEKLPLKFDRTIPGLPADKRVNVAALIELLDRELDRLNRERDK
jgi:transcriptional regulator with XRE-family HTH domain